MARVVAYVPDLLFGSRVQGDLTAAGHDVVLAGTPGALDAALGAVDAIVVDLTADADERMAAVARARPDGVPVLACFAHVEPGVRERARARGFELVVPRSRMAREGAQLLAGLLGERSGPGVE